MPHAVKVGSCTGEAVTVVGTFDVEAIGWDNLPDRLLCRVWVGTVYDFEQPATFKQPTFAPTSQHSRIADACRPLVQIAARRVGSSQWPAAHA
jgi:hypothetical protein